MKFPGVNSKQSGISRGAREKNHGISRWLLALEFPGGVTQICKISRSEVLFSLEFPGVK